MCPGGDDDSLNAVMPLLEKAAAKDAKGKGAVGRCGLGGSGHYVKMIHNGIEHGMMSAISEAWAIMVNGLGMSFDEVAETFRKWDSEGELVGTSRVTLIAVESTDPLQRGTFLINIGIRICSAKDPKSGERVLRTVEDKVVQGE